jgi:hypothetical protein
MIDLLTPVPMTFTYGWWLGLIQDMKNVGYYDSPESRGKQIRKMLNEFEQEYAFRDRVAKLQALYECNADGGSYKDYLDRLNAAGWDLVRMEKETKPYSEWEVRDMMNAAYRSEEK